METCYGHFPNNYFTFEDSPNCTLLYDVLYTTYYSVQYSLHSTLYYTLYYSLYCGAREAPNAQLSMLCSKVIHMGVEAEKKLHPPSESRSTEDMIAAMKTFNQQRRETPPESREPTILGSMDVAALYPSLDKDQDTKEAGDMVARHAHLFTSFNWVEGARFLALALLPDQIKHLGLTPVVHTRKFRGGAIPGLTTTETSTPLQHEILEDHSKLLPPSREASSSEQAAILGAVVSTATRLTMQEHTYMFNGLAHNQSSGGPMGDQVSVELSRATMLAWDIKLITAFNSHVTKLRKDNDISKRYVDDHLGTYLPQPPGTRWRADMSSLYVDSDSVEEDLLVAADVRTMRLVRLLANQINPRIQMVEDCPSLHESGKMPVLDLQCWVDEGGFLQWEFYRKPMSNPLVPLTVSALPARVRRTTHAQEGIRILRNCSETLPWSTKAGHLTNLMRRLKMSGYNQQYRSSILSAVLAGYQKQLDRAAQPDGRPLHRPDTWQQERRAVSKASNKTSWYRAGGYSSVLFVPPTPGSTLSNMIKKMELQTRERRSWSFRVVELGGRTLKTQLQTLSPAQPTTCGARDCIPCVSGKLGICGRTNVCYQISCLECLQPQQDAVTQQQPGQQPPQQQPQQQPKSTPHIYIGETSKNLRTRSSGHVYKLLAKDQGSPLWKHATLFHRGRCDINMFTMDIISIHRDPLTRQITEGVFIKNSEHPLMNSRAEYKQPRVTRVTMARNLGEPTPPPNSASSNAATSQPRTQQANPEGGAQVHPGPPPRRVLRSGRGRGTPTPPPT